MRSNLILGSRKEQTELPTRNNRSVAQPENPASGPKEPKTLSILHSEFSQTSRSPTQSTMSKKRRRDPGTIDIQLVEIYEDLSNQSEEIRLKAAHALLDKLAAENALSNEKFTEVLTRLVRGLCSGRKAARLGFSIAFTEFLVQHLGGNGQHGSDRLGFAEVFDVLIKQTDIGGNVFGQVDL